MVKAGLLWERGLGRMRFHGDQNGLWTLLGRLGNCAALRATIEMDFGNVLMRRGLARGSGSGLHNAR